MAVDMKQFLIWALSFVCLCFVSASAEDSTPPTQYRQLLETVPALELPAKAAELVKQAESRHRATTAASVTKEAVTLNPPAAPGVVSAIAKAVPELAATVAGTATTEQPKQATAIAEAAATAAPLKAGKIVVEVCRAAPSEYRSVAIVAAQTNPGSAKEPVGTVASVIPNLQAGVKKALTNYSDTSISVAAVLDAAVFSEADTVTGMGPSSFGSTFALPFIPRSETVKTIPPDTSGDVPTGGREIAEP